MSVLLKYIFVVGFNNENRFERMKNIAFLRFTKVLAIKGVCWAFVLRLYGQTFDMGIVLIDLLIANIHDD